MQKSNYQNMDDEKIILSSYSLKNRVQIRFSGQGRTKQSFKAECDINNIMARFLRTGVLDFAQKNAPRYGDVTGWSYQSAMHVVASAKTMFNELPAALRAEFDNDPGKFYEFVNNPRNRQECEEMGLLKPEAQPVAEGAVPSSPAAPAAHEGSHEPLRAKDGTFREHTRAELRAEAKATKAAKPSEPSAEE